MPRNGSGSYSLPQPPFVAGTVISSAAVNSDFSDIASALTASLPRDGQAGMTGQLRVIDGSLLAPSYAFNNDTTSGFFRPGAAQIGVAISSVQVGLFTATGYSGNIQGSNGAIPVGALTDYAGSAAPSFWLLCFGQAVSRTTYSLLFAVIGTTYGAGDGSTTFNLPDLRDVVSAGKGNMGGTDRGLLTTAIFGADPTILASLGGAQTETLNPAQIPAGIGVGVSGTVTVNSTSNRVTCDPANLQVFNAGGGTGFEAFVNGTVASTIVTSTGSNSMTGVASGGGQAHPNVQPTIILNKIIFAGV